MTPGLMQMIDHPDLRIARFGRRRLRLRRGAERQFLPLLPDAAGRAEFSELVLGAGGEVLCRGWALAAASGQPVRAIWLCDGAHAQRLAATERADIRAQYRLDYDWVGFEARQSAGWARDRLAIVFLLDEGAVLKPLVHETGARRLWRALLRRLQDLLG